MKDILHSVCLRHDNTLKSLTKQALAQIVLKLIYQGNNKGLNIKSIKAQLINVTGVRFSDSDILESLRWLVNTEHRIYQNSSKYYIKEEFIPTIDKAVQSAKTLEENVIEFWFSKSATFKSVEGKSIIMKWFQDLLIEFFKDYSYDWIRDLMPKRGNGVKKVPNIERIIDKSLLNFIEDGDDHEWLKKKFIGFIESIRPEDNELLWNYGSSRFSATLLTARNYADEFSLEAFHGADFILDTNILMILELEAYEQSHALNALETFFINHNIKPKYFYISRDEYTRAIGPKRDSTLTAFERYSFNVFKETDCIFIKTALNRGCLKKEDFVRFFDQIMDVPDTFGEELKIECEDNLELNQIILAAQEEEVLKEGINKIYKRRTGNDKRETPVKHDAGLHKGVEFMRKTNKALILTRDSVLREYAYENAVRDELPLAIGIDSLIQMLALHAGGTESTSTDFAPLFSKLIQASLYPEKDMFKPEDLEYISHSHININDLPDESIVDIAKRINKLRYSGVKDEEIILELRRLFQYDINGLNEELLRIKSEEQRVKIDINQKDTTISTLASELIESKTRERIRKVRNRVILNWIKLIGSAVIILILVFLLLDYSGVQNKLINIIFSILSDLLFTILIYFFTFKGKLYFLKDKIKNEVKNEVLKKKLE